VWIVRHRDRLDFADPDWGRRAPRPHDPPLSPAGLVQAQALARWFGAQRVAHVFSSPFLRAVETAHAIAVTLRLPLKIEPGLSEWLSRAWFPQPPRLRTPTELAWRFPSIDRTYRPRGGARYGESGDDALARSGSTARRLAVEFGGDLLLMGHGASLLGATAGLLELPPSAVQPVLGAMPYAGVVGLHQYDGRWAIDRVAGSPVAGGTVPR
jgi:broad specificity phosphatase PhoE